MDTLRGWYIVKMSEIEEMNWVNEYIRMQRSEMANLEKENWREGWEGIRNPADEAGGVDPVVDLRADLREETEALLNSLRQAEAILIREYETRPCDRKEEFL